MLQYSCSAITAAAPAAATTTITTTTTTTTTTTIVTTVILQLVITGYAWFSKANLLEIVGAEIVMID